MSAAVILLGAIAVGCVPAARLFAAARWPRRSPAIAIALWQALGLGWGLATVGALIGIGSGAARPAAASVPSSGAMIVAANQAGWLLRGLSGGGQDGGRTLSALTVVRAICLMAGLSLLALLCWILFAAGIAVLRARHRQRILLRLLAHGDPKVPGALVVDHPAAAAYCVPGLRSKIVISAGTIDLLGQAELAAVLAHERAHLRARHDLVLLPFTALLGAFGWSAAAREANTAVALLVEMLADDQALRHQPARELATALLRVGAAGGGAAPAGALAAAGMSLDAGFTATGMTMECELAARVTRLLRPLPRLPIAKMALLGMLAAALVLGPVAAMLLPL